MAEQERPTTSSTTFALVAAGRAAQRRLDDALAARGVGLRHLGALGHLLRAPELSYSDLARRAGVTPQSMRATVRQLEALGAVTRAPGGQGRAARLEVTDEGRDLLTWAGEVARSVDEELLGDLSEAERRRVGQAAQAVAMSEVGPGGPPPSPR
jgi:DNA-binding MarR family transcriptional regulator